VGVAENPGEDRDQGSTLAGPTVVNQAEEVPAVLEGSNLLAYREDLEDQVDLDAASRGVRGAAYLGEVGPVDVNQGEEGPAAVYRGEEGPAAVYQGEEGPAAVYRGEVGPAGE